jgi:hypothetical protein
MALHDILQQYHSTSDFRGQNMRDPEASHPAPKASPPALETSCPASEASRPALETSRPAPEASPPALEASSSALEASRPVPILCYVRTETSTLQRVFHYRLP